jgi:hypothetical protein
MSYIVTKSPKSYGVGILLILALGPIGLFYASVLGGIVMTFIFPIGLAVLFLVKIIPIELTILLIPGVILYYIIVLIWGIVAINSYNRRIENNAYNPHVYFNQLLDNENSNYQYYRELEKRNSSNYSIYIFLVVIIMAMLLYFIFIQ